MQRLSYLLHLEPLLAAQGDKNIFIIVPDFVGTKEQPEDALDFLRGLFAPDTDEVEAIEYIASCLGLARRADSPPAVVNRALWEQLLDRFRSQFEGGSIGGSYDEKGSFSRGSIRAITRDMHEWEVDDAIGNLVLDVATSLYSLRETIGNATLLGSDPIIYAPDTFIAEWFRGSLGVRAEKAESQGVGQALLHQRTDFLEALSLQDLIRIRSDGVLEELRRTLRVDRSHLRHTLSGPEAENEAAFLERLFDLIEAFSQAEQALTATQRKSFRRGLQGLGVTAVLGAIGLLLPPVVIVQLVSLGAGLTIGGKTVLDLFEIGRASTSERESLESSPIGLLYDAWSGSPEP